MRKLKLFSRNKLYSTLLRHVNNYAVELYYKESKCYNWLKRIVITSPFKMFIKKIRSITVIMLIVFKQYSKLTIVIGNDINCYFEIIGKLCNY